MNILVLSETYTTGQDYAMSFVHTRNLQYLTYNINVSVLSFQATTDYEVDGVKVLSELSFLKKFNLDNFDLIISHAPNIKNHLRFILKNLKKIKGLIFFFHGHEILLKNDYYPSAYPFIKNRVRKAISHYFYDRIKVRILKQLFKILNKRISVYYSFVSNYIFQEAIKSMNVKESFFLKKHRIIPNPVHPIFNNKKYKPASKIIADFVCIRPFDKSHYSVDLYLQLAKSNPKFTFSIYGQGEFFKHYPPPPNLTVYNYFLKPEEIPNILNQHNGAVMFSRHDSQGVMACEMASYGIPLIVSDIPASREFLSDFQNVTFVKKDSIPKKLKIPNRSVEQIIKKEFSIKGEIELIKEAYHA